MRILILEPPVHTPSVMPYSITMMKSVLKSCLDEDISVIDLNSEYHYNFYQDYYDRKTEENFFEILEEFQNQTRHDYPKISSQAIKGKIPKGHDFLMKLIYKKKPDFVAISLTYNSQVFFASGIIKELTRNNIPVVIGGPADKSKIKDEAVILEDYDSLLKFLVDKGAKKKTKMEKSFLDFSDYDKKKYFTTGTIYPIRTAYSCPYRLCAFCTHHANKRYSLIDLDFIKNTIEENNIRKVFFIDDNFTKKRISEIIRMMKNYNVEFWMQLRPEKWILDMLPELYDVGLRSVAWGLESGSQRILDLMQKGTNINDIKKVLKKSHEVGIKNIIYIMFGFPTETRQELMETMRLLEENRDYIDLVSPTVFGLQKGSIAYENPERYGISNVFFEKRTLLGEKINFEIKEGMSHNQVRNLKKKNLHKIYFINKVPKIINSCKEQILNI